jgi:DNA (cytosine-5)-methyltransferase 1
MRVLSLFSGIGGLDIGLERSGMTIVAQCELDSFCRLVLAKHWPHVARFADVRTLTKDCISGPIDIIAGGFPCQDISISNHAGSGISGSKSGLWSEFARIIRDFRPRFVLVENVPNILNRGIGKVLGDLAACRYDAEWDVLPACEFGADILRERLFIIAQPEQERRAWILRGRPGVGVEPHPAWGPADSLDSPNDRAKRIEAWLCQPAVLGSLDGIPSRLVERQLGGYGNAVVPQVSEWIGRAIMRVQLSRFEP